MAGENSIDSGAVSYVPRFETFPHQSVSSVQNSSSFFIILIGGTVLIIIIFVVGLIIKWIVNVKKFNRLRHHLIPIYTYDPNEEENEHMDFSVHESTVLNYKSQDYQSIEIEKASP